MGVYPSLNNVWIWTLVASGPMSFVRGKFLAIVLEHWMFYTETSSYFTQSVKAGDALGPVYDNIRIPFSWIIVKAHVCLRLREM